MCGACVSACVCRLRKVRPLKVRRICPCISISVLSTVIVIIAVEVSVIYCPSVINLTSRVDVTAMQILVGDGEWLAREILQRKFAPAAFRFNWMCLSMQGAELELLAADREEGLWLEFRWFRYS